MKTKKYIYFKNENMWIGYWEEYPDYLTQGISLEELKDNLLDIYKDLSSDAIPCVHRVGELEIA